MKLVNILALPVLSMAGLITASCHRRRATEEGCLAQEDAQQTADNFEFLFGQYASGQAMASMAPDVEFFSDSIAELINSGCSTPRVLGKPLYESRAGVMDMQSSQPPIPFHIENLWFSCKEVFIRLASDQTPAAVRGLLVLEMTRAPEDAPFPWIMSKMFFEFNSGTWLVNLGVFTAECDADGNGPPPPYSSKLRRPR